MTCEDDFETENHRKHVAGILGGLARSTSTIVTSRPARWLAELLPTDVRKDATTVLLAAVHILKSGSSGW